MKILTSLPVNALETDAKYRGRPDEPLDSKEALIRQCGQIVELNYERNKVYDERMKLWKEHCEIYRVVLSHAYCCEVPEYWDLLEVGPSFFAPIMIEYAHDRGGYYYELLHELVHGHGLNAQELFRRSSLFDICREFLNGGEWDRVPKYNPTEWEIYLATRKIGPQMWKNWMDFGRFR